jgi:hypothetical protein
MAAFFTRMQRLLLWHKAIATAIKYMHIARLAYLSAARMPRLAKSTTPPSCLLKQPAGNTSTLMQTSKINMSHPRKAQHGAATKNKPAKMENS